MNALLLATRRLIAEVPATAPHGAAPPPGVALALRAPGLLLTAAAGTRSPEGAPMTTATHHDLASVTKVVGTSTALIRLVSDGLVGLDEPVRRFVPGFAGGGKDAVTVRDLLLHRGGLWEWWPLYAAVRGDRDAALRHAAELPLRYPPRSERHYSDLGFMLLGQVVEAATGQRLDAAVRALVTEPLGLAATRYGRPAGGEVATSARGDDAEMTMLDTGRPYPVPFRAADFGRWRRSAVVGEPNDGNAHHALGGVSGHAGLFAPPEDLVGFAAALADHAEHDRLWRPEVAEEFFTPGPDPGQSLGFRRYELTIGAERAKRLVLLGHPGFTGCAVGFVPGRGIALALASCRLLADGPPVPTDGLWAAARAAAGEAVTSASKHPAPPRDTRATRNR
ncbi:serine hydrolase domain-containing protein [Streptomyces sp. 8K308]|uniref:serine hydrolase domain-containing protein n=1 Tax=Streptomyces sp. 8K308 TaxID=2530388 RepID=UPI00140485F9|nr:serine hydrolase domain-containing protein [Streptomyces sp. 8K308]